MLSIIMITLTMNDLSALQSQFSYRRSFSAHTDKKATIFET